MSKITKNSHAEIQQARAAIRAAIIHKAIEIDEAINQARKAAVERETDDSGIKIKPGRPKSGSRPAADFSVPAKRKQELRSSTGLRSFHFAFASITRTAAKRGAGSPANYARAAPIHIAYIEDGAITRDGHTVYIDSTRVEVGPDGDRLVRSNISEHYEERREFFMLVDQHERINRGDSISVDFRLQRERWEAVVENEKCDPAVQAAFAAWRSGANELQLTKLPLIGTAADLRAVMKAHGFELGSGTNEERVERDGVSFHDGRGGRTEYRLVFELPREFDRGQRSVALELLCARLDAMGCMYVGVIHAPDPHNSEDNFHIHLDFWDRKCRRLDGSEDDLKNVPETFKEHVRAEMLAGEFRGKLGQWDFTVQRRYASNKCVKTHRPFAAKHKSEEVRSRHFVRNLREAFATDVNAIWDPSGEEALYDPRTYADMGIQAPVSAHLGPSRHGLETKGVATLVGIDNEAAQAEFARSLIAKDYMERCRELDAIQLTYEHIPGRNDERLAAVAADVDELIARRRAAIEIDRDLQLLRLQQDRQRSRAKLVSERQSRLLKTGTEAAQRRSADLVQGAQHHLTKLEKDDAKLANDITALEQFVAENSLAAVKAAVEAFGLRDLELSISDELKDQGRLDNSLASHRDVMPNDPAGIVGDTAEGKGSVQPPPAVPTSGGVTERASASQSNTEAVLVGSPPNAGATKVSQVPNHGQRKAAEANRNTRGEGKIPSTGETTRLASTVAHERVDEKDNLSTDFPSDAHQAAERANDFEDLAGGAASSPTLVTATASTATGIAHSNHESSFALHGGPQASPRSEPLGEEPGLQSAQHQVATVGSVEPHVEGQPDRTGSEATKPTDKPRRQVERSSAIVADPEPRNRFGQTAWQVEELIKRWNGEELPAQFLRYEPVADLSGPISRSIKASDWLLRRSATGVIGFNEPGVVPALQKAWLKQNPAIAAALLRHQTKRLDELLRRQFADLQADEALPSPLPNELRPTASALEPSNEQSRALSADEIAFLRSQAGHDR